MTTLTERLEAKRAEYAQVEAEQQKLWTAYKAQKEIIEKEYEAPWHPVYQRQNALAKEIEILEAMSKEMEAK